MLNFSEPKQLKSREAKLKFLKGLMKGKRNISEIIHRRHILLCRREENDYYTEGPNQIKWTEQDIANHKKNFPYDVIARICIKRTIERPIQE